MKYVIEWFNFYQYKMTQYNSLNVKLVKKTKTKIFRIQAYDSIMCGYFCIGFIDFMLAGKTLTDFTNLFSPNNLKKSDNIILKYFITNV